MAKNEAKRQRKYLREAIEIKKQMRKHWIILIGGGIAAIALWAVYSLLLVTGTIQADISALILCLLIVVFLGNSSTKLAKLRREYNELLRENGLTNEDVKAQRKQDKAD